MFDFGSGELLVIGIVALVVIGPKELPGLLRTIGQTVARLRRIAGDFQGQFQSALREADLHDAMKSVSDIQTTVSDVTSFNDPLANLPLPALPEPAIAPPVELQSPAKVETQTAKIDKPLSTEEKPKPKRTKKVVEADMPKDDPQAALFDTLDQMNKKAEAKPVKAASKKIPSATKAKTEKAPAKKAAKPKARKSKTGEASS